MYDVAVYAYDAWVNTSKMARNYRARYYDPNIGRFISEDPIGFGGSGTDFYAYVRNNPIDLIDPLGLCPKGRLICTGLAYVLKGNSANVGKTGFPGVEVKDGSAAVIPRQFTGAMTGGPVMRKIGASTFGSVTSTTGKSKGQTQSFTRLTQAVGEAKLGTAQEAQDIIMGRAPGQLVIEIVGGEDYGPDATVTINMPDLGQGCPEGTQAQR